MSFQFMNGTSPDTEYPWYVNTTDRAFSRLRGRPEYLVYACRTLEDAERVAAWAREYRSDLVRVDINDVPRPSNKALGTFRTCIYPAPGGAVTDRS